jgi:hypothetical protein
MKWYNRLNSKQQQLARLFITGFLLALTIVIILIVQSLKGG